MRVYIKNSQRSKSLNRHKIVREMRRALMILGLQNAELSILFVNRRRMQRLNYRFRGINTATDVLSFPLADAPVGEEYRGPLGDIVICVPKAVTQSIEHSVTFYDELRRLLVHGLLHLLGFDHEISRYQRIKMETRERELAHAIKNMA